MFSRTMSWHIGTTISMIAQRMSFRSFCLLYLPYLNDLNHFVLVVFILFSFLSPVTPVDMHESMKYD